MLTLTESVADMGLSLLSVAKRCILHDDANKSYKAWMKFTVIKPNKITIMSGDDTLIAFKINTNN